MITWKKYSIRGKLLLLLLLTSSVPLLLLALASICYGWHNYRQTAVRDATIIARRLASGSTRFLQQRSPQSPNDPFYLLEDEPSVVAAWVFDTADRPLLKYQRQKISQEAILQHRPPARQAGSFFAFDTLYVYYPIQADGQYLGSVVIANDLTEMFRRLGEYTGILLLVLIGSLLAGGLLAIRLQRLISGPIQELTQIVQKFSLSRSVAPPALLAETDDLRLLLNGFTTMLQELQERDGHLQQRQVELEQEIRRHCRTEQLLKEQEEVLTGILNAISDPIFVKNEAHALLLFNDAFCTLIGRPRAELIGKSDYDLFAPEEAAFFQARDRLAFSQGSDETEEAHTDATGVTRTMLTGKTVFTDSGGRNFLVGIARDITSRKETEVQLRNSEAKYRALFNQIADPVLVFDRQTHLFLDFSESALRLYGYSPEELRKMTPFDLHPPTEYAIVAERIRQSHPDEPYVYTHLTRTGRRMFVEILSRDIVYQERPAFIAIVRDVTERRKHEEQMLAFTERLKTSNRELEEFAFVASHDLQEPLRKVQTFGDRLKMKYAERLDDTGRDYIERMQAATGRMQTLINDLLIWSRVTTKARPFVSVELNEVAREVVSDLEARIERTGGRVELGTLPELAADPTQMRQLLQNLIGNGLKFHRPDLPPVVSVRSEGIRDEAGSIVQWRIEVADNGIGFEEKYLDRIFTIFQRLHGRDQYEGTGVGLAICRKIVERHGGTLTAHSQPEQGATFVCLLPAQQDHNEEILQAQTAGSEA